MQGTKVMHIFVHLKEVNNESRQCKITDEERHAWILYHAFVAQGARLCFWYYQKLKEAQLIVVEGTLYPLLTRLKNDDLLSYEWVESTQGPPRKYYKLTEQGEVFLGELEISWKELNDTVNHIANR